MCWLCGGNIRVSKFTLYFTFNYCIFPEGQITIYNSYRYFPKPSLCLDRFCLLNGSLHQLYFNIGLSLRYYYSLFYLRRRSLFLL